MQVQFFRAHGPVSDKQIIDGLTAMVHISNELCVLCQERSDDTLIQQIGRQVDTLQQRLVQLLVKVSPSLAIGEAVKQYVELADLEKEGYVCGSCKGSLSDGHWHGANGEKHVPFS